MTWKSPVAILLLVSSIPPIISGSSKISFMARPSRILSGHTATAKSIPAFNDVLFSKNGIIISLVVFGGIVERSIIIFPSKFIPQISLSAE